MIIKIEQKYQNDCKIRNSFFRKKLIINKDHYEKSSASVSLKIIFKISILALF